MTPTIGALKKLYSVFRIPFLLYENWVDCLIGFFSCAYFAVLFAGVAEFLYLCSENENERFAHRTLGADDAAAGQCLFGDEIRPRGPLSAS